MVYWLARDPVKVEGRVQFPLGAPLWRGRHGLRHLSQITLGDVQVTFG
jgi:hypothetical protein